MSPRTKIQNEALRQRSVTAIKKAALELFSRQGYTHTSISQIAQRASVSKGLLYNYFDGKEALLHEIIREQIEIGDAMMSEQLGRLDDPLEQLIAIIEGAIGIVLEDVNHWKLITSLAFQADVIERLMPLLKQNQQKTTETVSAIFTQLGAAEPLKETYLLGAMLDGVVLGYIVLQEDYDLQEMKQYILRRYLNRNYPVV